MRRIMQGKELELFKKIEPYIVYPLQNGKGIRNDSPADVVKAYEELCVLQSSNNQIPFDH